MLVAVELTILALHCLWLAEMIDNKCHAGSCGVCILENTSVALFMVELIDIECHAGSCGACILKTTSVALFVVGLTADEQSCWSQSSIHIRRHWAWP